MLGAGRSCGRLKRAEALKVLFQFSEKVCYILIVCHYYQLATLLVNVVSLIDHTVPVNFVAYLTPYNIYP